jgi:two-component system, cell cycle sensor histidine kinase and response regulator CckA
MASNRAPHILVVDCDKDMVEITTAMLERLGYSTQGEMESAKALRTFSDDPDKFDLAIIEPMVPDGVSGVTGVELAVRFRRIRRGFPVMLYSGYMDSPLAETIEAAGLGRAVPKPLGLRELGEAVKEAVHPPAIGTH